MCVRARLTYLLINVHNAGAYIRCVNAVMLCNMQMGLNIIMHLLY